MRWRLLFSPPGDGSANMAIDHALMRRARESGESIARVYSWSRPVLSFGRNQHAAPDYSEESIRESGMGVVRRPTGGRALLHCREITYSIVLPQPPEQRQSLVYSDINAKIVHALRIIGVEARIAEPRTRAAPVSAQPCFAEPSAGELVVGSRKIAGSAQWSDDGVLLQHGSILVHDDQSRIAEVMNVPMGPVPLPATIAGEIGRDVTPAEFAGAFFTRFETPSRATGELSHEEILSGASDLVEHYESHAWTWRR